MGFRFTLGGSLGRRFAGVLAVTAIVAFAAQGAIGAPGERKPKEARQGAGRQGAGQQSAGKQQTPAPAPDQQKPVTRMVGGVQVKVDPTTGRLQQPTAEEVQKLAAALQHMLSRETENLVPVQREDGSIYIDLQETFQEAVMASVSPKGKVTLRCVNDAAQASRILAGEPINDGAAAMSRAEARRSATRGRTAPAEKE